MTGYAKARHEHPDSSIEIEIRSVNHRHLHIKTGLSGLPLSYEDRLLQEIRRKIDRGSLLLNLLYRPVERKAPYRIDRTALGALLADIEAAGRSLGREWAVDPAALLVHEWLFEPAEPSEEIYERDWPRIEATLHQALDELIAMRETEGASIRMELISRTQAIRESIGTIRGRVDEHTRGYRDRLLERIEGLQMSHPVEIPEEILARELLLYAERSDITEELDRIGSHLDQIVETLDRSGETGRKLEFLTQEILREINTVGSKTPDPETSRVAISIKGELEKIREQIQNVE